MSLLAVLAAGAGAPFATTTTTTQATTTTTTTAGSASATWPTAYDSTVATMRPIAANGVTPLATLVVAADGSGNYTTLNAAQDAAITLQGGAAATKSPAKWVNILVKPGTYKGLSLGAPFIGWAGTTGNPADVTFVEDTPARTDGLTTTTAFGQGLMEIEAGYYEGITFVQPNVDPATKLRGKYVIHNTPSTVQCATVFVKCVVDEQNVNANATYGMNSTVSDVVFYDVTWKRALPAGTAYPAMQSHAVDHDTMNKVMVRNTSTNGTDIASSWLGVNSMEGGTDRHFWVDAATNFPGGINLQNAKGQVHVAAGAATTVTSTGAYSVDARTDWPVPKGCLSATDRAYWGLPA